MPVWEQDKDVRCKTVDYQINTLRTGSFKLFKRPFPGFF